MPLTDNDLADLGQYALAFRAFDGETDPCQAYVTRTLADETSARDLAPRPDEARAMLRSLHAMTHRLHPSTYEWYLNFTELLLVVISQDSPLGPLETAVEAKAGVEAAERRLRSDVLAAHNAGHSWADIGRVLGVSRQSAFERFSSQRD